VGRQCLQRREFYAAAVDPILHLSLPVVDLAAAKAFYVDGLGCREGRASATTADVWFFGLQLTLHQLPDQMLQRQGVRHFGVTLDSADLEALYARLTDSGNVPLHDLTTRNPGTPQEETKAYFTDPSGNVIELKAYADLDATVLATATTYG
jgi:extradiol dioxygenase family protein